MDRLWEQFRGFKRIIDTNVETLQNLIKQSEDLKNVIQELKNNSGPIETINRLEEIKNKIQKDIDSLVLRTKELFDTYSKLVEEIFAN